VRLPAGTYVSGPLTIRSRTTLRLEQGAVLLENVTVTAARAGLEIRHAHGVTLRNVVITPGRGEPIVTRDADVERE